MRQCFFSTLLLPQVSCNSHLLFARARHTHTHETTQNIITLQPGATTSRKAAAANLCQSPRHQPEHGWARLHNLCKVVSLRGGSWLGHICSRGHRHVSTNLSLNLTTAARVCQLDRTCQLTAARTGASTSPSPSPSPSPSSCVRQRGGIRYCWDTTRAWLCKCGCLWGCHTPHQILGTQTTLLSTLRQAVRGRCQLPCTVGCRTRVMRGSTMALTCAPALYVRGRRGGVVVRRTRQRDVGSRRRRVATGVAAPAELGCRGGRLGLQVLQLPHQLTER